MGFSHKLKLRLKELDMSQAELAERVGTSQSQVSDWVRKKSEPTVRYGAKVADALGVSMDYLFRESFDNAASTTTPSEQILLEAIRDLGPDGPKRLMSILVKLALENAARSTITQDENSGR